MRGNLIACFLPIVNEPLAFLSDGHLGCLVASHHQSHSACLRRGHCPEMEKLKLQPAIACHTGNTTKKTLKYNEEFFQQMSATMDSKQ